MVDEWRFLKWSCVVDTHIIDFFRQVSQTEPVFRISCAMSFVKISIRSWIVKLSGPTTRLESLILRSLSMFVSVIFRKHQLLRQTYWKIVIMRSRICSLRMCTFLSFSRRFASIITTSLNVSTATDDNHFKKKFNAVRSGNWPAIAGCTSESRRKPRSTTFDTSV